MRNNCRYIPTLRLRLLLLPLLAVVLRAPAQTQQPDNGPDVVVGAERTDRYLPLLQGKRVAIYTNQSGLVGNRHTLDLLLDSGVNVVTVFSPEHGFRGNADGGEAVESGVDPATGVKITSLYGGNHRGPSDALMDSIDVIVTDIQDVGLRYYTYYVTMINLMEHAARHGKKFVVFDRPNPNGMSVDGPILDMKYRSGVGRLPIPVLHGMTLGELALMANGEKWLEDSLQSDLTVIPCDNYTHSTRYRLPVPPSPNLRCMKAVYLYPSLCYFSGTPVSVARGTDFPYLAYGHPDMHGDFSFTPQSMPGSKTPPYQGQECHGVSLQDFDDEEAIAQGVNLRFVIDAYNDMNLGDKFFNSYFENLIGRGDIRSMIEQGMSAREIKSTWSDDVAAFRRQRAPYLLYPE